MAEINLKIGDPIQVISQSGIASRRYITNITDTHYVCGTQQYPKSRWDVELALKQKADIAADPRVKNFHAKKIPLDKAIDFAKDLIKKSRPKEGLIKKEGE